MGNVITLPFDETKHTAIDSKPDVHDRAVINIEVARLYRAMKRLPRLERRVIEHRYGLGEVEELSTRQIARKLGIPRSTVWDVEQRALELLRQNFGIAVAA